MNQIDLFSGGDCSPGKETVDALTREFCGSLRGDPLLGSIEQPGIVAGSIYVNVTADDKVLFVSE